VFTALEIDADVAQVSLARKNHVLVHKNSFSASCDGCEEDHIKQAKKERSNQSKLNKLG
jgi:hypothetical protein